MAAARPRPPRRRGRPLSAKANNRKKGHGRNRQSRDNHNYWRRHKKPKGFHNWAFRLTLHRHDARRRRHRTMRIDPYVTNLSWDDKLIQTANATLNMPDPSQPLNIEEGHKVVVEAAREQETDYKELWTLRVTQVNISGVSSQLQLELADELDWLKRSRDDFIYKKGKKGKHKKPHGWRADQVARDVAHRYGIKVGRLAKGHHQIKNLTMRKASPLKVIQKAYELERDATGTRFVITLKKGKLYVTKLRRSPELLILGGQTIETTLTRTLRDNFATELEVRSSLKREHGKHKNISVVVKARKSIQDRFGKVHSIWELSDPVDGESAAKKRGRRRLARITEPKQDVTVSVPGDPTLRRGDAVRVKLPRYLNALLYVKSASHTVDGGDYQTDLTMTFNDIYRNKKDEKTRDKICKKAKKHHRKPPKFCRAGRNYDPYAPPRHRNRGSHHHRHHHHHHHRHGHD